MGGSASTKLDPLRIPQIPMLLPQMLSELVLASIPAPLALGATVDWTEIELKQLIDTMYRCFMTEAIGGTLESGTTANYNALDGILGSRWHGRILHSKHWECLIRVSEGRAWLIGKCILHDGICLTRAIRKG